MKKFLSNQAKKHGLVLKCRKCKHEWDYYPYWMNPNNDREKTELKRYTSCPKCKNHVNIEGQTQAIIYNKRKIKGL